MSIRMSTRLDTSPLDALNETLDSFSTLVEQAMNATVEEYREPIKQQLGQMPGPVKKPVEWTVRPDGERRQQKAFFASNGFGKGIGAPRTGALAAAWEVTSIVENGNAVIVIRNPSDAAKFVYGGLGKYSNPKFKQQFHKNTGWLDAKPIVNTFIESTILFFSDTLRQNVQASISSKRRAYTGR